MTIPDAPPADGLDAGGLAPLAVAVRSGLVESVHHGVGVALAADGSGSDGSASAGVGDPDLVVYPRSAMKPLQAEAMARMGLDLPGDLLALVCASHDGSEMHLDGVRRLLDAFDLSEDDLANTPARPYGAVARERARGAGAPPSPLQQNCSGKHAGMLATCRVNGWPVEGYTRPDHPLQVRITAEIEALGCAVRHVGIDGCGAPAHAMTLRELARGLGAVASSGSAVPSAMREFPEWVGGPERDVTIWMRAVPGLIAKDGAAGAMGVAMPDGRAAAFKIADGSDAARQAVAVAALRALGIDVDGDLAGVAEQVAVPVLGHGLPVGTLRALDWSPCSS